MSMDILSGEIKKDIIRNVYLFYGPEEYLKKYYMNAIETKLLSGDLKALNKVVFEDKIEEMKVIEACETLPVFSERKVVIVKNSGLFKIGKKSDKKDKKSTKNESIAEYILNLPEYVCLIFYENEIDKRLKLVDAVKKRGLIAEFPLQKPAELIKWATKVFRSFNKEIDQVTAAKFIDYCEAGMNEILNEINKIVLYLGDRVQVTPNDIEKVCTKSIKSRIFDLTDAISEKNSSKAMRVLNDMISIKEPLPKILFMIARHFRQMLEIKLLHSEGLGTSFNEIAGKMSITPYAASKILSQSGKFSVEKLKNAAEESLNFDIAVKTGLMKDITAIELLIIKFSM